MCAQGVGDLGMKDVFAPEHGADGLLGEIIVGRAEAARGNDDVCAAARELQCLGETCGIVADDGVIEHVDAERGELLREHLRVRVGDVAEKDLGADGNEFSGVGHGQPPKSPTRTTAASAAANAKRQRSISGGRIHFARGFLFRSGSPRDPRSRGALAMLPRRISVPTAMSSAVWDMGSLLNRQHGQRRRVPPQMRSVSEVFPEGEFISPEDFYSDRGPRAIRDRVGRWRCCREGSRCRRQ